MGLKRKASFDDASTTSSSLQSLPPSSPFSSADTAVSSVDRPLNLWNIAGAPYFNSRTRKRFRDGRPDEQIIHQNTLNKLFNAQKQNSRGSAGGQEHDRNTTSPILQSAPNLRLHTTGEPIRGPTNVTEAPRYSSQRSLDAFFGSSQRPTDAAPRAAFKAQAPLPSSIYQPQDSVPHLVPSHPRSMPSVLTCEDCDAPLLTKSSGEAIDAEMLDVDGSSSLMDPEIDNGWSCSLCAKRVCDVCAVRGNYRVCLECAVPGAGKYRQEELQEKRWVGGIGWM